MNRQPSGQQGRRWGLTGGIGSGKSTVGQLLAQCGAVLIDADQIARSLTAPGGAAMPAIVQQFGADFVDAQGALHRDKMRAHAFAQPAARQQLEAIIHPLVGSTMRQRTQAALADAAALVVLDIPLLVESGHWPAQLDAVLVVDCTPETQINRVMARNGLERAAIERILTTQASRVQRLAHADMVFYNDGLSLAALQQKVYALANRLGLMTKS